MRNSAAGEVCEVRGEGSPGGVGNSGGVVQSNCGTGASRSATLGCGDPGGSSGAGRGPGLPARARHQPGGGHTRGIVGKLELGLEKKFFYPVHCPKL